MENDPFYSDYDDNNDTCWTYKFIGCDISIDSNTIYLAELIVPIKKSNVVQKFIKYIENYDSNIKPTAELIETVNDKEIWHVESTTKISLLDSINEFCDDRAWK